MNKILFIIGSLRKESFNKKLAKEVEEMLDGRATVEYLDYSDVPLMNQDIEFPAPEAVKRVRERVAEADALWIFSPVMNPALSEQRNSTILAMSIGLPTRPAGCCMASGP